MSVTRKLELLAPAKNLSVGKAAINHGADAVYIGAPDFGARKQAANNLSSIEELINYAHIYGAKVFIALNTILYEHELEKAHKLIHQLYNIGADALIIQDMGILEMDLPPITIHASTQANNFDLKQVSFFDKIGIRRAVLARELSVEEIKKINASTSIELEAFIHGALCVSLSGQCYLSQSIGQRSANRGECAQACRLKYSLSNKEGQMLLNDKYLLSLKDFSVGAKISQMAYAGIKSFKIEGRLKDEGYVKNVVTYYRQVLDKLIESEPEFQRDSSGKIYPKFTPDLNKSFNRRFTSYFLFDRAKQMASLQSPKSFGEPIGEVIECKNKKLQIKTNVAIANGDGLCFINEKDELKGIRVEKVEKGYLLISDTTAIKKGTQLFRNHNHAFLKELDRSEGIRKIHCTIEICEDENEKVIRAVDEDNYSVSVQLPDNDEIAKKQDMVINTFHKQFLNITDDYFRITQFHWKVQSEVGFYRIAEVNQFRRTILEMLLKERIKQYQPERIQFKPSDSPFYKNELDYAFNVSNSLAVKFYACHGANVLEKAPEITENYLNKKLMTTRYCIKYELGICEKKQLKTKAPENSQLFIENKFGKYRLEFDCGLCMMYVKSIK